MQAGIAAKYARAVRARLHVPTVVAFAHRSFHGSAQHQFLDTSFDQTFHNGVHSHGPMSRLVADSLEQCHAALAPVLFEDRVRDIADVRSRHVVIRWNKSPGQYAFLEVSKLRFRFAPQIFPASEDHLMQLLFCEEHAHLLDQLLAIRAHMPFHVVFQMLFGRSPGRLLDMQGDVLLRQTAAEFLDLKASHYKNSRAASLEDQHAIGCTKIQCPKHRSQQKPPTHIQLSDRLRRREFKLSRESLAMARIQNPPVPRAEATLLRLHQNGFQIFSQAWSLLDVHPVLLLPHQIADEGYLRMVRLVWNRLEAEEERDGVTTRIAKICEVKKIPPGKHGSGCEGDCKRSRRIHKRLPYLYIPATVSVTNSG